MSPMDINVVFMGSPNFAIPILMQLSQQYRVVGVITQPDRPAGRGQVLTPPPIKVLAASLGLPVIQPEKMRNPEAFAQLQAWNPDLIVVAAFGQILRQNVLDLPRLGCINVHASLLPRWRGAAPIQAAILNDDGQTGVSIMKMDAGIDTGPVLAQRAVEILPTDTAGILSERLAETGASLLLETLPDYLNGSLQPQPQENALATYASMLKKEEGELDISQPANALACRVMAFNPWPGAFIKWQGQSLKILQAHAEMGSTEEPGKHGILQGVPAIAAGQGWLVLDEVQPAGKKPMPGKVFLNGARHWDSN
jgi:methionyl-tRNA formyltransferase